MVARVIANVSLLGCGMGPSAAASSLHQIRSQCHDTDKVLGRLGMELPSSSYEGSGLHVERLGFRPYTL